MMLAKRRIIDEQIGQLDQEMATLLAEHHDAVQRLAEVPGLGVDSREADHQRSRRQGSDRHLGSRQSSVALGNRDGARASSGR
jgi:hypothetical protein